MAIPMAVSMAISMAISTPISIPISIPIVDVPTMCRYPGAWFHFVLIEDES